LRGHDVVAIAIAAIRTWFSLRADKEPLQVRVFVVHDFDQVAQVQGAAMWT
jgi:hypothetical protein